MWDEHIKSIYFYFWRILFWYPELVLLLRCCGSVVLFHVLADIVARISGNQRGNLFELAWIISRFDDI